ncbi:MAG: transporter [Candidatus Nitrotoga sp.]
MQCLYAIRSKTFRTFIASRKLFILSFGLLLGGTVHAADTVTVSSGVDYSTGDYGQVSNTNMLVIPFSIRYRTDAWTYRLTTAHLYIEEGASGGLIGGDFITNKTGQNNVSGMGDLIVSARYRFNTMANLNTKFSLAGKVKLATADETKGLGTGSNDYTVELGAYQPLINNVDMFSSLGYRIKGDLPQTKLNNVWLGSVGLSFPWSKDTEFGLIYDFRQATSARVSAVSEVSAYWDWRASRNWSLNTYTIFGLSDASPNFGVGTQISYNF